MIHADEHYRAPLLWLLAPYLGGLVIAAAGHGVAGPLPVGIAIFLAGAALAAAFARGQPMHLAWTLLLGSAAALGGVVHMHHALDPRGANARWAGMPEREANLEVRLTRLFAPGESRDEPRQLCLAEVTQAPPPLAELEGMRVCFSLTGEDATAEAIIRSARVRVRGILRHLEPAPQANGGFEDFLQKSGVRFVLERAELRGVVQPANWIQAFLQRTSHRFASILRHGLPEGNPATGVYIAMFLGQKTELSEAQKENYLRSGTMHLFAISGLHIAVIAGCLHGLLAVTRMPPRTAAAIGLVALWIFVEATGGTPSARRAFLMVAFVWAGMVLRRPANPLASLVTSALIVLVWDPLALLSASFQLSYAVVASLLLYGLPLRNRWHAWWKPWRDLPEADWSWWQQGLFTTGRGALSLAAISCSATLISTPLSIAYFQLASPGAIFSNLALVPITTSAIAAGFASLLSGLLGVSALSTLFNHAGALILAIVDRGAGWAAAVPGMFFPASFSASWMAPAIVLTLLAVLVTGYARGWLRLPGRWWAPPAVLVSLTALLVTWGTPPEQSIAHEIRLRTRDGTSEEIRSERRPGIDHRAEGQTRRDRSRVSGQDRRAGDFSEAAAR